MKALFVEADRRAPDLACFLRLAAATGCRRSELCALTWADVDLERGQVVISKALSAAGPIDGTTKGTKTGGRRRIAIDSATAARRAEHQQAMKERADAVKRQLGPWVFSSHAAGLLPWHPSSVSHRFLRVARAAGVETHLHSLRHFSATTALDAGVPIVSVAHRLGHSRTSTTTDIYGHFVPDRDQAAAKALGRALS
ncbi:MAG TPA: site-specific integrase [Acidimicrobiales bacterium]|nr:site-specific integrase [Acidimicrobiales bacterium]